MEQILTVLRDVYMKEKGDIEPHDVFYKRIVKTKGMLEKILKEDKELQEQIGERKEGQQLNKILINTH